MSLVGPITVEELAALVGGDVVGDGQVVITQVASLETAHSSALSFFGASAFAEQFRKTQAGCLLLRKDALESSPCATAIIVDNPYAAFVKVVTRLVSVPRMIPGTRHETAVIASSARIHETAAIGPGCVIADGVAIEAGAELHANVVVDQQVSIGESTSVRANVAIGADTVIGARCIIHAGAVLGSDGFGYIENHDHSYTKIPQIGNVVLGDDVEIGANVTIDRAALGSTLIGNGVKIDNLVQIAHGVVIGDHSAIAAQTGVSGGAVLGKRTRLAGQVGVAGHIAIADDVIVLGQSGVTKSLLEAGVYSGSPAQPHKKQLRNEAAVRDILGMRQQLQELSEVLGRGETR